MYFPFNLANKKAAVNKDEPDPFQSNLPEIDVEEDFKQMNERNQIIDKELEDISVGVSKLKEIANDMNKELDDQNDALRDLEKGVDKVLDDVDNVNIKLKRIVDTVIFINIDDDRRSFHGQLCLVVCYFGFGCVYS